jgi:hypothetical protein
MSPPQYFTEPTSYHAKRILNFLIRMAAVSGTLTAGVSAFADPQWKNYPKRFYRLRRK